MNASSKGASSGSRLRRYTPILLIAPAFLIMLGINVFPFVFSLAASFSSLNLRTFTMEGVKFVGLDNYLNYTFADPIFTDALGVSFEFVVLAVSLELVVGFYLAFLLDQDLRGIGLARSLFLIPMAISPLAVGLMFKIELQQEIGIIAFMLRQYLGIVYLPLSSAVSALTLLVLVDTWMWAPFVALVLLAGLRSIPLELDEAARIDGASSLQRFIHIVLPALRFPIMVVLLIRTMDAFKVFDIVWTLTGGAPGRATATISFWIYKVAMQQLAIGKASALTYIVVVVVTFITTLLIRIMMKPGEEE